MKLIDEKGRLFGKVNVVDLVVFIIIVGIIGAVGYRLNSSRLNAGDGNILTTEDEYCYITLMAQLVIPEISQSLEVGEKLISNGEYTDAEIVSIEETPAAYVGVNNEGEATLSEHPLWKDVKIVVKEKANPSLLTLKVGEQEVRVGRSFILKTQTVEVNCRIRDLEFKAE